jgi:hypothetical protein
MLLYAIFVGQSPPLIHINSEADLNRYFQNLPSNTVYLLDAHAMNNNITMNPILCQHMPEIIHVKINYYYRVSDDIPVATANFYKAIFTHSGGPF